MCFWKRNESKDVVVAKIPLTTENVLKCFCGKCPVQAKSNCAKGKMAKIGKSLAKKPLAVKDIPGLYCTTGKATCKDIDKTQKCICGTCPIWGEFKLADGKTKIYFCRDGRAR
jgi:hypothetical protein